MTILGPDGEQLDEPVLDDVKTLSEEKMIWEHKCIEGWSQVAVWTGARFSQLAERYDVDYEFVSLTTRRPSNTTASEHRGL